MSVATNRALVLGAAVSGFGTYRVASSLCDKNKGSLTNRIDCTAEKVKNDASLGLKLGVPVGVGLVANKVKPGILGKVGTKCAEYLGKVAAKLAAKFPKAGLLTKVTTAISKNPMKYGIIGLVAGTGLYALNALLDHANKDGKIDQKYNDAAALENMSKNVVLNA